MAEKRNAPSSAAPASRTNWPLWLCLVLVTLLVTAFETALLDRKWGILSGGFLQRSPINGVDVPLFLFGSLFLDAMIVFALGLTAYQVVGRIRRLNLARRLLVTALIAGSPLMIADFVKFQIARYLGDTIDFRWLSKIGGGEWSTMLAAASGYLIALGGMIVVALVAFVIVFWLLRWMPWPRDRRAITPPPGLLRIAVTIAVLGAMCVTITWAGERYRQNLATALGRKFSGTIAMRLTNRLRTTVGLASLRPDPRQQWHPPQTPGDFADEQFAPVEFVQRPDVLFIVLESFRYDNVGATVDGQPVTPVIDAMLEQGAVYGKCYSPNAFTAGSLKYLFRGGRTLSSATNQTLIDDFLHNGYYVACISAQNEAFDNTNKQTGMLRAHHYVTAEDDRDARISPFSSSGSLAVPWPTLTKNVQQFLDAQPEPDKPLFMYVNIQDCHFPYNHYAMEAIVCDEDLGRGDITPSNAVRVQRQYRNAAANVDRTLGKVLDAVTQARGRKPAVVIVGDHGESLFDPDMLGHGIELLIEQHATPLIVDGLPAACTFPMAHGEVREMIRQSLSRPGNQPQASVDPTKGVFLHVGSIEGPYAIGLAGDAGIVGYNFRARRSHEVGEAPDALTQNHLMERWCQIVQHRREAHAGAETLADDGVIADATADE